ncbi:MAG: hypothetical protein DMG70_02975 [Acidobacteria bacterium]|nr:MAG: hypothetical protein DMG70_02975 [Acidobacteriota bacterium]
MLDVGACRRWLIKWNYASTDSRCRAPSIGASKVYLEALCSGDGTAFKDTTQGKGHTFWTAYPVELAEDLDAAANVYRYVLNRVGVNAPFEMTTNPSPGVMFVQPFCRMRFFM